MTSANGLRQERGLAVAGIFAFRLILDWNYVAVVAPVFPDEGYALQPSAGRLALSWVLTLMVGLLVPTSMRRPSDVVVTFLAATPVLPMLTLLAWRGDDAVLACAAVAATALVAWIRLIRWPTLHIVTRRGGRIAAAMAGAGVVVTLVFMIARGGLAFASLDLQAVYVFRDVATELTSSGRIAYLVDWSVKVFIPVLAAVALANGKRMLAAGALLLEIPLFALTAQKGPLGVVALLLLVVMLAERKRAPLIAIGLMSVSVAVCTLAFTLWESVPLTAYFARRVFFVPASLNYAYDQFFSTAGRVSFATVLPSWVVPYRFALPPAQLVGDYIAPGTGMWANTGFIGAGSMHLGLLGVALYSVVLGGLLGLADEFGTGRARWPVLAVVIVPFTTVFTSADLPTALITHGIALSLAFAFLIGGSEERTA
jgi:hypothetical protein